MEHKFKTIYADPPWAEAGGGQIKRGADRHYELMSTKDIIAMKWRVREISAENCHLYLWTTNNFLHDALHVMQEWGFDYKTVITWTKRVFDADQGEWISKGNIGLGQYFRGVTEHCLFGVKGVLPYKVEDDKRQQGITGFYTLKEEHSVKPEYMRKLIEKVSYPPYIELFARTANPPWTVMGLESDGTRF